MQPSIWLVEDNEHNALVLELILVQLKHRGEFRHFDSADGLRAVLQPDLKPDILLLDIALPGEDGLSLGMWIRSQQVYDSLKLVVVTAQPDPRIIEAAHAAGFQGLLKKPVRAEVFREALDQIVSGHCIWPL